MLSQRIVKGYLMLGQGIATDDARTILQGSIKQFESQLATLKTYQPTPTVRSALVDLEGVWKKCKPLLAAAPSKADAAEFYDVNEALQGSAHRLTVAYESVTGAPIDHLIGIAGRQRMLSQRMAKFYMFRQWGIKSPSLDQEAQLARREFVSALGALDKAQENDAAIKGELELARTQWLFFDEALKRQDVGGKDMMTYATNVATTSERLLEVMDRITGHYARISAATAPAARKR